MTTTGPDAHPDQVAALRGRLLAAHADLDQTRAGSREHRRGVERVIAATDALLVEQEQQLTIEVTQQRRRAVAVLRPIGGAAAAAMVVVLVLAPTGVIGGWWWLLALPVLVGVTAVLALSEPHLGAEFTAGVVLLGACAALVVASVLRLLPLLLLIPLTLASLLVSVGLLLATGPEAEREAA